MKFIGVDVGGTKIAAGVVHSGTITHVVEYPVRSDASRAHVVDQICKAVLTLGLDGVSAVGVGIPSVIDPTTHRIVSTKNIPAFKNMRLDVVLRKRLKIPVYIHNDAKAFALGQLRASDKNIVGLIVGTGIGAGVIMNRSIVTGTHGSAGEIGSVLAADGKSLEYHLAGPAFIRRFGASGVALFGRASLGDPIALSDFEEYGRSFATVLSILMLMYEPSRIVIGGSVAMSSRFFLPSAVKQLKKMHLNSRLPSIVASPHAYSGVIGAASLCLSNKKAKHY